MPTKILSGLMGVLSLGKGNAASNPTSNLEGNVGSPKKSRIVELQDRKEYRGHGTDATTSRTERENESRKSYIKPPGQRNSPRDDSRKNSFAQRKTIRTPTSSSSKNNILQGKLGKWYGEIKVGWDRKLAEEQQKVEQKEREQRRKRRSERRERRMKERDEQDKRKLGSWEKVRQKPVERNVRVRENANGDHAAGSESKRDTDVKIVVEAPSSWGGTQWSRNAHDDRLRSTPRKNIQDTDERKDRLKTRSRRNALDLEDRTRLYTPRDIGKKKIYGNYHLTPLATPSVKPKPKHASLTPESLVTRRKEYIDSKPAGHRSKKESSSNNSKDSNSKQKGSRASKSSGSKETKSSESKPSTLGRGLIGDNTRSFVDGMISEEHYHELEKREERIKRSAEQRNEERSCGGTVR